MFTVADRTDGRRATVYAVDSPIISREQAATNFLIWSSAAEDWRWMPSCNYMPVDAYEAKHNWEKVIKDSLRYKDGE